MYEQYLIKNITAFGYFLKLSEKAQKLAERLDKNPEDEKLNAEFRECTECLEATGRIAFGEKEFQLLRKDNPDVPDLPEPR